MHLTLNMEIIHHNNENRPSVPHKFLPQNDQFEFSPQGSAHVCMASYLLLDLH